MKAYRVNILRKVADFGRPATTQEIAAAILCTCGGAVSALQHLEREGVVENVGRWYSPMLFLQTGTRHNSAVWAATPKGHLLLKMYDQTKVA